MIPHGTDGILLVGEIDEVLRQLGITTQRVRRSVFLEMKFETMDCARDFCSSDRQFGVRSADADVREEPGDCTV